MRVEFINSERFPQNSLTGSLVVFPQKKYPVGIPNSGLHGIDSFPQKSISRPSSADFRLVWDIFVSSKRYFEIFNNRYISGLHDIDSFPQKHISRTHL